MADRDPGPRARGDETEEEIEERYPKAHFTRKGAVVACKAGAYAEELFAIKRHGVLASRGIFK